jgi:hypothetical protein
MAPTSHSGLTAWLETRLSWSSGVPEPAVCHATRYDMAPCSGAHRWQGHQQQEVCLSRTLKLAACSTHKDGAGQKVCPE